MGLVLLRFDTDTEQIKIDHFEIIRLELKNSNLKCCISPNLKKHFFDVTMPTETRACEIQSSESNMPLKIIELVPPSIDYHESLFALAKMASITQIECHEEYHECMIKYLLLSEFLCFDTANVVMDKLFWLIMNDVYVSNPKFISWYRYSDDKIDKYVKIFQNLIKKYPCNWMLS
uniref:Uncharacterized protein n=1 Tax=viral metagenome TaxID=1070528 RepID=A0A6C0C924_9ZZZZ